MSVRLLEPATKPRLDEERRAELARRYPGRCLGCGQPVADHFDAQGVFHACVDGVLRHAA